jgi:hypothetical protein
MPITETDKLEKANANTTDLANARAIVFDRRWDLGLETQRGYVELRVLESPQSRQCEFYWSVRMDGSIPLQYTVDVSGDTYREVVLPSGARLSIDVANFRTSRRQSVFDLLVELRLPNDAMPNLRLFHDTVLCAVPTKAMVEDQARNQLPNIAQLERALASVRAIASAGS